MRLAAAGGLADLLVEGGGAGIHAVCAALQDALRPRGNPIVFDSCNPYHSVWELLSDPESSRQRVTVESR